MSLCQQKGRVSSVLKGYHSTKNSYNFSRLTSYLFIISLFLCVADVSLIRQTHTQVLNNLYSLLDSSYFSLFHSTCYKLFSSSSFVSSPSSLLSISFNSSFLLSVLFTFSWGFFSYFLISTTSIHYGLPFSSFFPSTLCLLLMSSSFSSSRCFFHYSLNA